MATVATLVLETLEDLEEEDFRTFLWFLSGKDLLGGFCPVPRSRLEKASHVDAVKVMEDHYGSDICAVTEKILGLMNKNGILQTLLQRKHELVDVVSANRCHEELKNRLKEVTVTTLCSRPLGELYTEMHILRQDTGTVNMEHETLRPEPAQCSPNVPNVTCNQIFSAAANRAAPKRVLTKGVAGIGKTVVTQKFILDWAEGRENQDLKFVFPITFQELNLMEPFRLLSLVELVHQMFPEVREAGLSIFRHDKVAFIFDGFDESRADLDFQRTSTLTDITQPRAWSVLLVNLIRGKLLPNARVWVTSRPAAANQIPAECFHMITEIQGFTDRQKEEYLKKLLKDEEPKVSQKIISHIKEIRTLYIMCHNPMFIWIAALALRDIFKEKTRRPRTSTEHVPKTLTELYICFLIRLAKVRNIKFNRKSPGDEHWSEDNKKTVMALAKFAFEQLSKGNLTFSEWDLRGSRIDIEAATTESGLLTEVSTEESSFQSKAFCFIHLSVQEMLAALHVHSLYVDNGYNALKPYPKPRLSFGKPSLLKLHQSAVDRALDSPHGHWDLFLRFLLGLSQTSNQRRLQGLLKETRCKHGEIIAYIHRKLDQDLRLEQSMNLFHCLAELNDCTLETRIRELEQSGPLSAQTLTPSLWSALTFLQLSKAPLEEFDLKKFSGTETALRRLLPVVQASRRAQLDLCSLSDGVCSELGLLLSSDSCLITHLDLSDNDLRDSGIERLLCALERPNRSLQVLRLRSCLITAEGCASLASALKKNLLNVTELDLSYNHPGAAVEKLTSLQQQPQCSLQSFRAEPQGERWLCPGLSKYLCALTWDTASLPKALLLTAERQLTAAEAMTERPQAWCVAELSRRCYWEAECYGDIEVKVICVKQQPGSAVQRWRSFSAKYRNKSFRKTRQRWRQIKCPKLKKVGVFLDLDERGGSGEGPCGVFYLINSENTLSPTYIASDTSSDTLCAAFRFLSPGSIVRLLS